MVHHMVPPNDTKGNILHVVTQLSINHLLTYCKPSLPR